MVLMLAGDVHHALWHFGGRNMWVPPSSPLHGQLSRSRGKLSTQILGGSWKKGVHGGGRKRGTGFPRKWKAR